MPKLPSGKLLAISRDTIVENDNNFFRCPDGHFWYQTPDLAINRPPFPGGEPIIMDFAHAPAPATREEVQRYICVLFATDDGDWHWRGDMLSDFPPPGELDEKDLAAWNEWISDEERQCFLDDTIEICRRQAEINRENTGALTSVESKQPPFPKMETTPGLGRITRRLLELDEAADAARASADRERGAGIHAELEGLLDEIRELRSGFGGLGAAGAHLEGLALRVLHRWNEAEAQFRACLKADPFHSDAWLELTWCLAASGRLEDAEEAARRSVKLLPEDAASWGNLAMTLIQQGRREEAREVLDIALDLDPDDAKNTYVDEHFEELFEPEWPHRERD